MLWIIFNDSADPDRLQYLFEANALFSHLLLGMLGHAKSLSLHLIAYEPKQSRCIRILLRHLG